MSDQRETEKYVVSHPYDPIESGEYRYAEPALPQGAVPALSPLEQQIVQQLRKDPKNYVKLMEELAEALGQKPRSAG